MKKLIAALMLSLFVMTSGCYHITYDIGKSLPANTIKKKVSANIFLGGMVGTTIYTNKICSEILKFESKMSGVDWLLSWVTFGIYTPRTVLIYCAK